MTSLRNVIQVVINYIYMFFCRNPCFINLAALEQGVVKRKEGHLGTKC